MTVAEANGTTSEDFVEITLIDPETDKEITFRAATEEELDEKVEAYFDPFHESNDVA